ncbi:MAG TPA: trigger factor, partial [Ignavibacteria bacterium]
MEFRINKLDETKQEVEFEVPYTELEPHFEKSFKKYQKKAQIPGFRKGKAPISMIKRMYGDLLEQGSLEDVANDVFREYLEKNDVKPLGEGSLMDINYEPKQLFTFKVKYEVRPDINIENYKGIEVSKTVYRIDEKMIDEEIEYLRSKHCTYEEAEKAIDEEYVVTADISKLDDSGIELIGQQDKGVKIYLNDKQLNNELKEQLENIEFGEERVVMIPTEAEGKTEKFKIKAIKIEKVIFPELNEEFFKHIYHNDEIKTETEFREKVRSELEGIYNNISDQELRNNIVSEMIKLNDVPVPDVLVENVLGSYIEDIKNQNPKRELPKDFDKEEYRKTKRVDAILRVKWYLMRDKIIELEKIEVTDEDMQPLIEADSKRYNLPADKIKGIYEK